jgi:diguanylate cyclase (GGDEF)-like protein
MPLDDLTQLNNRRDLFIRLKQEIARSKRTRVQFSILMIDVDHFKAVNDNFGHLRGDRVLTEIAQILKENCREMDVPCRYGGDEFVVIMPETDRWAAEKAAQRVLQKLSSHLFPGYEHQPDLHLTVSIGAATFPTDISTPTSLLERADQALYLAKNTGRNRICKDEEIAEEEKIPSLNFKSFINRIDELNFLKKNFNTAFEGNGSLIVISGEAGVGKTRSVMELKKYSTLRKTAFLFAKPFEFGVTPPYHIFFQVIKQYIQDIGQHNIEFLNKLQPVYKAELVKFIPELLAVTGTIEESSELPPEYEKMRLFDAIYRILEIISQKTPIIIFFDDMQWASDTDLELLGYLIRNISFLPIFVCCTYRVEEVGEKHPLNQFLRAMSREHRFEKIDLKGFDYATTKQMLNAILSFSVPENISEKIYHATNGNPFYIEEIIKSLVQNKIIHWDKTNWAFKDIEEVTLPSSIGDLLKRRLEGINPELKELLTQASVIGNEFSLPMLKGMTEMNEGYLIDLLDLGLKNLLIRVEPNDYYSFENVLLQRTLYEDLSPVRQHRLHLQIARALEILNVGNLPEVYEMLAYHYLKAEDWQCAYDYSLKAANKLKELYANQDAISHYQVCLELITQNKVKPTKTEIKIRYSLADVYYLIGNYMDAIENYKVLLKRDDLDTRYTSEIKLNMGLVYQKIGDYDGALKCYDDGKRLLNDKEHKIEIAKLDTAAIWIYSKRGEHTKALSLANNAIDALKSTESEKDIITLYNTIGTMYYDKGEWDKAEDFYKKSLDYAEKSKNSQEKAAGYNNLGNVYHRKSIYDEAIEFHSKALKIRKEIGDRFGISSSLNNIAIIYDEMGEWQKALDYHQKSLEISKSLNSVRSVALSYSNLGFLLHKMGELTEAAEYSLQALEIFKTIGELYLTASAQNNLANTYLALDKIEAAFEVLKEAAGLSSMHGFKVLLTENHRLFAEYYLSLEEIDKATDFVKSAVDIAQKIGDKVDEAEAHITLGKIYTTQDKFAEAEEEFKKCKEIVVPIKEDYIYAECHYYCGISMKKKGDKDQAKEFFNQAKSIFERLGSKRYLDLLNSEQKAL